MGVLVGFCSGMAVAMMLFLAVGSPTRSEARLNLAVMVAIITAVLVLG